eukprot:9532957-Alexandrium_andersonii.AAC.1
MRAVLGAFKRTAPRCERQRRSSYVGKGAGKSERQNRPQPARKARAGGGGIIMRCRNKQTCQGCTWRCACACSSTTT